MAHNWKLLYKGRFAEQPPRQVRGKHFDYEDDNAAMGHVVRALSEDMPIALAIAIGDQYVVRCILVDGLDDWPDAAPQNGLTSIGAAPLRAWTVREDELTDLRTIVQGLGPLLMPSHRLVSFMLSIACMIWRLRRNGVSLNPLQQEVLVALRRFGPLALSDLSLRVRSEWSQQDVAETLRELSATCLTNGTVVPLVSQAADSRWSTNARGLWEVPFGSYG